MGMLARYNSPQHTRQHLRKIKSGLWRAKIRKKSFDIAKDIIEKVLSFCYNEVSNFTQKLNPQAASSVAGWALAVRQNRRGLCFILF